ncbi:hypothetical protein ES708_02905 [subsurface metagenome]
MAISLIHKQNKTNVLECQAHSNCQATPGGTTWAGIRQCAGGNGELSFLPAPAKNSLPPPSTSPAIATLPVPSTKPSNGQTGVDPYVQLWTSNSADNKLTRVIGWSKLHNLLQPKHPYFEGKWAEIKFWSKYLDKKADLVLAYPRVQTFHRENPFRKYQLNRQCSARSAKKIFKLIDSYHLAGFRITDIETTMPAATSAFLASQGRRGRDIAWGMNRQFWDAMIDNGLVGPGHARHSNLHSWKTSCPLEPHFHFHELLPNYERVGGAPAAVDMAPFGCSRCGHTVWVQVGLASWQCATCYPVADKPVFKKREWVRRCGGGMVPWTSRQLLLVKAIWLDIQINYARRYCIQEAWSCQDKLFRFQRRYGLVGLVRLLSFLAQFHKGLIDVYATVAKLNSGVGKAKFLNKLSYNGRHPVEDFAVYSNKNPDCSMPGEFTHYDNRARLFGWWRDVKKMVVLSEKEEKIKLSPYTAEPMEYLGHYSTSELVSDSEVRKLVAVDIIRGSPVERVLGDDDFEWVERVVYQPSQGGSYQDWLGL